MNDFHSQLDWATEVRPQLHRVYNYLYPGLVLEIADAEMQTLGDTVVTLRGTKGASTTVTFEEKCRMRPPGGDILIEHTSNAERGTAGWIYTNRAEFLIYGWFVDSFLVESLVLSLPQLRHWFTLHRRRYLDQPAENAAYTTISSIIPFEDEAFQAFRAATGAIRWTWSS